MTISYAVSNPNNWSEIWSTTLYAPSLAIDTSSMRKLFPWPAIDMPFLVTAPILIIFCRAPNASLNWRYAGLVKQKVNLGISEGTINRGIVSAKKLYLNQFSIFRYPVNYSEYALEFNFPYWIREMVVKVWEYTGSESDSIQTGIEEIKQLLGTGQ